MRIARRIAHILLIVLALLLGATAAAVIVAETSWFKNWLRGYIVREAGQYINGQLSIGRLGGNLFSGVELDNIGISMDGSQVVAVANLGLKYNIFELVGKGLSVRDISLARPVIYLRREGDTWSLAQLIKKQAQEADREGPASPIAIDHIGISGASVVFETPVGTSAMDVPDRIDDLDAELSFKYEPVRYSIEIAHVSFRGSRPAIGLNALSGSVAVKDDTLFLNKLSVRTEESSVSIDGAVQHYLTTPTFNVRVSSDKLSLPEIARVMPSLEGVRLQPALEVALDGTLDKLGVDLNVRSSAGQISGNLTADVAAPGQRVSGQLAIRHLDLGPLMKDPAKKSDLTFDVKADVQAADISDVDTVSGTATLDAPRFAWLGYAAENIAMKARFTDRRVALDGRANAYGASATTSGTVTISKLNEAVDYNLRGTVRHLDARRLPAALQAPSVETDVNADYAVRGAEPQSAGKARDVDASLTFAPSTAMGVRVAGGSTANVAMHGQDIGYGVDATVADVDVARIGRDLQRPALADARYISRINARISARGHGTDVNSMKLSAQGELTDSSVLGGRVPQMSFAVTLDANRAHVTADGDFADIDPSIASGRADVAGAVAGNADVDVSIDGVSGGVGPDNVSGTVRATLEPSHVGDLKIDWANLDADYDARRGEVRDFEIAGHDLIVRASGPIALDESGQSQLAFHVDTPNLQEVAKLAGLEIGGIANSDGVVTGNRPDLQVSGKLTGDNVKYGEGDALGALTTTTNFTVHVPELDYTRAYVDADTSGTFVTIAGQEINELAAKTTYADKQITFDATAKQPARTLSASGAVALRPDAEEVRLQQLALESAGQQWRLRPNSPTVIQYGGDRVTVNNLTLENGAQTITASGTVGKPGDELTARMDNVDVAALGALLLQPPQFSGRLNASAVVSGTTAMPAVKADFRIDGGGFRQFHYDTLGGTASYDNKGVVIDARLQQNPTQWLTARGFLPKALFVSGAEASSDPVDLFVDSSPIDLGIVQGFTTQLTQVTGTLEAHVHVAGSAAAPEPTGAITIQNGAARVAPTGVSYNHIAGKIDLRPTAAHIDEITVLDSGNNALSITGDLAVREGGLGGVQLYVNASDFKLLDNKIGDVHMQTNLEIAGDMTSPRITGDVALTKGKIDLDQVYELAGASPYATTETQYETAASAPAPGAPAPAPAPSAFSALSMDVGLSVPNDFVVKANDLQTPGAPIGLGALNLTIGGDLHANKVPGGTVRVRGTVNTVRGTYDFQGRRFDILRDGTVRFDGLEELDPALNLRAERLIQGVTAQVNVRGTLYKPQIVLTSTPPLEQADILSLIVFNQPINQMSEGQQISLVSRAESMAAGAVTNQLAQSIGRALNLDTFEINLAPETGGGPQITVGQQVSQNLYVKVQQGVGDESSTNFVLEYELSKWLRLQTNVLQGTSNEQTMFRRAESTGADLLFFFSY